MTDTSLTMNLGTHHDAVKRVIDAMAANNVIKRIWEKDHTLWKDEPTEISNRLGWLDSPANMADEVNRLLLLQRMLKNQGYTHVLLLGMGGSSLAPELFAEVFGGGETGLKLAVLDSTDPGAVQAATDAYDPATTLYIVASKSGGTAETLSFFKYFYNLADKATGELIAGGNFIAITDPGSKLADIGQKLNFLEVFLNDPDIGGRYSALSFFGLVPAALAGVDVRKLLERASSMAAATRDTAVAQNDGARLGAAIGSLALAGRDKLTIITTPGIERLGDWVEQLIAESTGKEGKGILPVVGEPPGDPDAYGEDRVFVYVKIGADPTHDGKIDALEAAGHPVIRITLPDSYDLGGQFFLWEVATAVAGHVLSINPFDQPNVEAAKNAARMAITAYEQTGNLPEDKPLPATVENLQRVIGAGKAGDYVAVQAFVQPTGATTLALGALRMAIRKKTKLATTANYGPRYLHSTGQLHKGDGGKGIFIILTADSGEDLAIPDEAGKDGSAMTFGTLKMAQALGDKAALVDAKRRVVRFQLEDAAKEIAGLASGL